MDIKQGEGKLNYFVFGNKNWNFSPVETQMCWFLTMILVRRRKANHNWKYMNSKNFVWLRFYFTYVNDLTEAADTNNNCLVNSASWVLKIKFKKTSIEYRYNNRKLFSKQIKHFWSFISVLGIWDEIMKRRNVFWFHVKILRLDFNYAVRWYH